MPSNTDRTSPDPPTRTLEVLRDRRSFQLALEVRIAVFVHEQGVPLEEEEDLHDATAFHLLGRDPEGRAVATGRLVVEPGQPGRIGRMAVLREARGQGWGRRVMERLVQEARDRGLEELVLDAQVHAIPFYEGLGFRVEGPEFPDCGIPHRRMRRRLLHQGP